MNNTNPSAGKIKNFIRNVFGGRMKTSSDIIQESIGYTFRNPKLLTQALTRKSYTAENGGEDNEVLEFIGDKALDLAVIRMMVANFGIGEEKRFSKHTGSLQTKSREGFLTETKSRLVQKKALSKAMDRLGFHRFLIMGAGDMQQNIQEQPSVKEDLFEAIIGAVTLDCGWNSDTVLSVVTRMLGDLNGMPAVPAAKTPSDRDALIKQERDETTNYKGCLQEWSQGNGYGLPDYQTEQYGARFVSEVSVPHVPGSFRGEGSSKVKAETAAAKEMYLHLQNEFLPESPLRKALKALDRENALSRLNELKQINLIPTPKEFFYPAENATGTIGWTCEMSLPDTSETFLHTASTKQDAKKECTYKMLCYLLNEQQD